jgi:hypothetical protein
LLAELEYASLFSYPSKPLDDEQRRCKSLVDRLKEDLLVSFPPGQVAPMSTWIASQLRSHLADLPFNDLFDSIVTLVPVPRSSLMGHGALWPGLRLAQALLREGVAKDVRTLLERRTPLRKSAIQLDPKDRPKAREHYETLGIPSQLVAPESILLIDDIVTRGATLLGAASRLVEAYPNVPVRAFVAFRTVSNPLEFTGLYNAQRGRIVLQPSGETLRRP